MSSGSQFDADYFLHGRTSGKSLYEDYRWLEHLTVPMVERMIAHLGIARGDVILDYGCARGYVVKAFRMLGYEAFGIDVSEWAIENADPEAKPYCVLANGTKLGGADWVIAKDVLEHVHYVGGTIDDLLDAASKGVFAVVPLSKFDGTPYVVPDYEKDVTHCQRCTLLTWAGMFARPGWRVEMSYRVPGVKDNYARYERGNGFITCRRIEEKACPQLA